MCKGWKELLQQPSLFPDPVKKHYSPGKTWLWNGRMDCLRKGRSTSTAM